jgi:uncharacterized SAM-binding protein YcdF (DUF218 family)
MCLEVRSWRRRASRLTLRLLAVPGLAIVLSTCTPIDNWWASELEGQSYYCSGEVLIVLSGSRFEDGTMGWSSYLRSLYAVRNFRDGGFRQIVVTGGALSGTPIAVVMADWMRCHQIPTGDIHVETASLSTRQSALYTRDLLTSMPGRKVLLTSDYHMFRARRVFAKLGVQVLPQPVPDVRKRAGSWISRWSAFCELLLETGKIGYYWLRGWI